MTAPSLLPLAEPIGASRQIPFDIPPKGARQFFKHRLVIWRDTCERLLAPWKFCRVCGEALNRYHYGRTCEVCHTWSRRHIMAAESARVRRLFEE